MRWRTCFEVTIYTSAANMLPLPGGAMAKLAAMKSHGVNYRTGSQWSCYRLRSGVVLLSSFVGCLGAA